MPLLKTQIAQVTGVRLVTPTWEELGGASGIAVDLGTYQFYPIRAYIVAPLRGALAGVLYRLFLAEGQNDEDIKLDLPSLVPRAIWPHTIASDELLEVTFSSEPKPTHCWKELLALIETITLPKVFPWLRQEQCIAAVNHGRDITVYDLVTGGDNHA
jgi:hypothetical protein